MIDFLFNGNKFGVQCNSNDTLKDIFQKAASKIEKEFKNLFFLYQGNTITEEEMKSKYEDFKAGKADGIIILIYEMEEMADEAKSKNAINDILIQQVNTLQKRVTVLEEKVKELEKNKK